MASVLKCKIAYNKKIADGIFLLGLKPPRRLRLVPGQFFMLRVKDGLDPLLGRPLDWFDYQPRKDLLEFVYQVVGRGTELLSLRQCRESITILGPLGKGLKPKGGRILLVAGGAGLPGLWHFCRHVKNSELTLVWGAKNRNRFFLREQIPKSVKLILTTEDGSLGRRGLATDAVRELLDNGYRPDTVYASGPQPMLKAVAKMALSRKIPGKVLYSERMACGVGACLGCAVPSAKGGYLRACSDGPAFAFEELDWERVKC